MANLTAQLKQARTETHAAQDRAAEAERADFCRAAVSRRLGKAQGSVAGGVTEA